MKKLNLISFIKLKNVVNQDYNHDTYVFLRHSYESLYGSLKYDQIYTYFLKVWTFVRAMHCDQNLNNVYTFLLLSFIADASQKAQIKCIVELKWGQKGILLYETLWVYVNRYMGMLHVVVS